jgi:hypothetical protein
MVELALDHPIAELHRKGFGALLLWALSQEYSDEQYPLVIELHEVRLVNQRKIHVGEPGEQTVYDKTYPVVARVEVPDTVTQGEWLAALRQPVVPPVTPRGRR